MTKNFNCAVGFDALVQLDMTQQEIADLVIHELIDKGLINDSANIVNVWDGLGGETKLYVSVTDEANTFNIGTRADWELAGLGDICDDLDKL